jgi:hypothetical protein
MTQTFIAFAIFIGVGLAIMAMIGVLATSIHKRQAEWRLDQIRKDPEAYRLYQAWETQQQALLKEGFDKTGKTAGKVAGGALKGAAFLAKMILKK